jgi:hypothetical protein
LEITVITAWTKRREKIGVNDNTRKALKETVIAHPESLFQRTGEMHK